MPARRGGRTLLGALRKLSLVEVNSRRAWITTIYLTSWSVRANNCIQLWLGGLELTTLRPAFVTTHRRLHTQRLISKIMLYYLFMYDSIELGSKHCFNANEWMHEWLIKCERRNGKTCNIHKNRGSTYAFMLCTHSSYNLTQSIVVVGTMMSQQQRRRRRVRKSLIQTRCSWLSPCTAHAQLAVLVESSWVECRK